MKTIFYLTQEDVAKALQNYVLDSFCYCVGNYEEGEIITAVEDVCVVPTDEYAAYVTVKMEKE